MDISSDGQTLIAGYENGDLILWDINTGSNIKSINGVHELTILNVKFWQDGKDNIIASDAVGNINLFSLKKKFLSYIVEIQPLLSKSNSVFFEIEILKNQGQAL
jgi:WD40 repeat protein